MSLAFVFDEHLRGPLRQAILRRNLSNDFALDVVRVGDPVALRLGATDAEILMWAEGENRLLVTEDRHTMATHLQIHLRGGRHCPGILITRIGVRVQELVECLELIAEAGKPGDFADAITYIP
jgi:predicted nuclease of predicted toxin-antitoxin system